MQTLKTAVIVVLMLTVVYGAYVSLTTPPVTVPEEIAHIIETDPAFADFDRSPYDLLGIDDANPASMTLEDDSSENNETAVMHSFADADQGEANVSGSLATRLPPVPAGQPLPQLPPGKQYDSTGQNAFEIPNPGSLPGLVQAWGESSEGGAKVVSSEQPVEPATGKADSLAQPAAESLAQRNSARSSSAPDAGGSGAGGGSVGLANALLAADQHVEADRMREALATLSMFYSSPDLSESDRQALLGRLDPLAGEVIYSQRHLLEKPYRVEQNETLMEIAARFEVPWQLLANINGINDPVLLLPGTELKVVRGPFRAEVDLARRELTVMLDELYAGRFPVDIGQEPTPQPGTYTVKDKQTAKEFFDNAGTSIPAGDASNPFGSVWIDLGQQMAIHGRARQPGATPRGCIAMQAEDAQDVYGILSQGSTISVRR